MPIFLFYGRFALICIIIIIIILLRECACIGVSMSETRQRNIFVRIIRALLIITVRTLFIIPIPILLFFLFIFFIKFFIIFSWSSCNLICVIARILLVSLRSPSHHHSPRIDSPGGFPLGISSMCAIAVFRYSFVKSMAFLNAVAPFRNVYLSSVMAKDLSCCM
jgi:hypothetical protein